MHKKISKISKLANKGISKKKKLILIGAIALSVGVVAYFVSQTFAYASSIRICNHPDSVSKITARNRIMGAVKVLEKGGCATITDWDGATTVDVDPDDTVTDVDSWKKRKNSGSWDNCYNNEDSTSNPYSTYTGVTTQYRNYGRTGC